MTNKIAAILFFIAALFFFIAAYSQAKGSNPISYFISILIGASFCAYGIKLWSRG